MGGPASPRADALRVEALGDRALVAVLGDRIDPNVNARVHQFAALVRARGLAGVTDLVPAYATLTVHYDPALWAGRGAPPHQALREELLRIWGRARARAPGKARRVELPVCYGGEFGPDLAEVASRCGLSEAEVVRRHSAAVYRVYMLGFAPGFAYLGGLDPAIAAPRRETPRLKVPAGSVGIAGMQTGIYPLETPGGWQIIGRSPMRLFRPGQEDPCLLRPGDRLRFAPIDLAAYRSMEELP